ncbi:hypothetical protein KKB28_00250, partial [bacterium]|nr:hypothetical protein [bacterium]
KIQDRPSRGAECCISEVSGLDLNAFDVSAGRERSGGVPTVETMLPSVLLPQVRDKELTKRECRYIYENCYRGCCTNPFSCSLIDI